MVKRMGILEFAEYDGYVAGEDGYTEDDIYNIYSSANGARGVAIYVDEESAVAGIKYEDGTFGVFGAGMDADDLTENEMYDGIAYGR